MQYWLCKSKGYIYLLNLPYIRLNIVHVVTVVMRMRPYFSSLAAPTSGEAPSYQESRTCQSLVEKAAFFLALEPWRPFAGLEESPFDRKAELSRAILVEERLKVLFEALVRMSFFWKKIIGEGRQNIKQTSNKYWNQIKIKLYDWLNY